MSIVKTIIDEIADQEGVKPTDLPPLAESIDPDALERVIETADTPSLVQFTHCDYQMTIWGDCHVSITRRDTVEPQPPERDSDENGHPMEG